ncbi:phage tail tape measure protein [Pseudomonas arsenicoxydans]|uniref:Phage tail tape measure protein n=1 Tax=Pseudomonas arsenicoxydans TaxID=702115 RepID=A0A4P6G2Z3_9PSED|nr:phage tail tape measure protein [Pseudomonas arsenicoxydans]QAY84486.1 phage tail tape measure protein [Pseudomonas arsenicoxydans]
MAESKYSPPGAEINRIELPPLGSASETLGLAGSADLLSGLNVALTTASLDIHLLVDAQEKLREALASLNGTLSSQQSLLKANTSRSAPATETKSKLKAEVDQHAPPEDLQSAMAMQTAMVDINQKLQIDPDKLQVLSHDTSKIAAEKLTSPSGTTGVQLVQVQMAAVNAGLVKNVKSEDLTHVLTDFARDTGIMASAYKIDVKDAGELLTGWRTSLKLDREKSLDLGDAANRLGASVDLTVTAADIGSVVKNGGDTSLAAGMKPEQVAAIAAALLNTSMSKDSAGASLKTLGMAFGRGDKATPEQRAAWAQLDIEPGALASRMRTDAQGAVKDVLAVLKSKPAEQQRSLIKTLFEGDDGISKLLNTPQDLNNAFTVASDKSRGSMAQTADARGNTSQARWNALDASRARLDTALANAVAPLTDLAILSADLLVSGVSWVVEAIPKVIAGLVLVGAALATPFRGPILSKLTSIVSSAKTELLKPDAAIKPPGSDAIVGQDQKKAGERTQDTNGKQKPQGAANTKTPSTTIRSRLATSMTRAKTFTGRLGAPLALASASYDGVKALMAGDYKAASGAVGSGVGGLAGGYAGAATGAMIGSFIPVPVVGTAIGALVGGLIGSYVGSMGGEALGESIYTEVDRLQSPDQVSKDLTTAQTSNQQNSMTANIYINGQDQASASQLANLVVQQITGQFGLMTMPNSLAMRSDAALTDGGS